MGLYNKNDSKTDQLSKKNFQFLHKMMLKDTFFCPRYKTLDSSNWLFLRQFHSAVENFLFVSVSIDVHGVTNNISSYTIK